MRRPYIIAVFAAVGMSFTGPLTSDSVAFARAVDAQNPDSLVAFAQQNPTSPWAADALQLAANQQGKGTDSNEGQGKGGTSGNQGSGPNPDVGNAGTYGG